MSLALDWLIVGGGIHGVHLATRLLGEAQVAHGRLRIVDPAQQLLDRWRSCTATTGMTHLRSPSVHNLDVNPMSLLRFAGKRKRREPKLFVPPYDRPSLPLFDSHCDQVMEAYALDSLHVRARAVSCTVEEAGVRVRLSNGQQLIACNLVLAIGASEQPEWPEWAPRNESRVRHVFAHDFEGYDGSGETIAVVGGGISAGQVALHLANQGHPVHLISRHSLRQHQFDSDPGWLGPKFMAAFDRESCMNRRRELIADARHLGSVPPDVARLLRLAIKQGRLQWHQGEVSRFDLADDGVALGMCDGETLRADHVLLATGFAAHRPGGTLVDSLVESASLPCASCGYPIVDSALRWHPRVHVSGPLAELELGPVSRNIAGARRAGDILVDTVRGSAEYSGVLSYA